MDNSSEWPQDLNDVVPFNSDCQNLVMNNDGYTLPSDSLPRLQTQFKIKKLKLWNKQDVYDWLQSVCQEKYINESFINMSVLTSLSGSKLMKMTLENFMEIERTYGEDLYHALEPYRRLKHFGGGIISDQSSDSYRSDSATGYYDQRSLSRNDDLLSVDNLNYPNNYSQNLPLSPSHMMNNLCLDSPNNSLTNSMSNSNDFQQTYNYDQLDFGGASPNIYSYGPEDDDFNDSLFDPNLTVLTGKDLNILDTNNCQDYSTPQWDLLGADTIPQFDASSIEDVNFSNSYQLNGSLPQDPEILAKCGRAATGRRRRKTGERSDERNSSPTKRRTSTNRIGSVKSGSNKKERGKKVWEFLLDLLEDPETNPKLIRWEDKSQGIFRLIEHDLIAQKWGMRREKSDLSYDYFARTMRYQYTTNMLESVPERKLVYKFGPEVMNRLRQ